MGNSSNAYMTEKPIGTSMSDLANNVIDTGFRYRQEKRINDEIARRAKEAEDKKKADLETKYSEMKSMNPTGIKSVDEAMITYINQAQNKRLEFYKKELKGEKLSPEEVVLNKRLQNLPDTLSMMVKSLEYQDSQYLELIKKGDILRDSDYEAKKMKMASGSIPFLDKDFNPVIGFDNDGDGKPEIVTFDLNEGFSLKPKFIPNIDETTALQNLLKTKKEVINQTDDNFKKVTTTGYPLADAQDDAKGLMYLLDGSFTPLVISQFAKAGIKDPNQIPKEKLDEYENHLTKSIVNGLPRGVKADVNEGAINAAARLAFDQKKEDAKQEKPVIGEPVEPSKERWGLQYSQIGKGYKSVPVTGKLILNNIPVKNLGGRKGVTGNVSNAQLEDYSFDGNGNLLINVSYEVPKSKDKTATKLKYPDGRTKTSTDYADDTVSSKERANEQIRASRETASKVARQLGMTLEEMKKQAVGENKETAAERAERIANEQR